MLPICRAAIVAALWCACVASVQTAAAEVSLVDLGGKFGAFALNPETGDLAALNPKGSTITLFRSEFFNGKATEKVGPTQVGSAPVTPVAIAYKKYKSRGVFAVVGRSDGAMYLFDARDLSLVRKVPMTVKSVHHIAGAPPADNPFIYYSATGDYSGSVGRVNLARLTDEGSIGVGLLDFAVSATGTLLYGIERSSSDTRCVRVVEGTGAEGKPSIEILSSGDRLGGTSVADPHEYHHAVDANVMSADMRKKIATLEFPVRGFFAKKALIIGQDEDSIMIASYNSFELLARVDLPKQLHRNDGDERSDREWEEFGRVVYEPYLFADDAHDRIIAARTTHAAVIPLKPLGLPEEPLILARVNGPTRLKVGAPVTLKVTVGDAKVKWKVESPPEGMKIVDQTLQWTPTAEQVGPHELQIALSHGELKKTHSVRLEVSHPYLKLSFFPAGLAASSDGKHAVAWAGFVPHPGIPGAIIPEEKTTHIAVLDLEKFSIKAEATLPFRAATAAIDGTSVYVAAEENNYMQVFPLAEPAKRKQVVADEPIVVIEPVNGKLVLAGTQTGGTARFSLPDLTRTGPKGGDGAAAASRGMYPTFMDDNERGNNFPALNLRKMQGGWLVEGVVYDADVAKPRLLVAPPGFFPLSSPSERGIGFRVPFDHDGGRHFRHRMYDRNGSTTEIVHDQLPAKFTIATSYRQGRFVGDFPEQEETITLTQADIVGGAARDIVTLAKSQVSPGTHTEMGSPLAASAGKGVLVTVQNKVFYYVPKALDPADYPTPLRFEQEQSALVVDAKGTTTLKHKLIGAKQPVQFAAIMSRTELKLDVDTGEISVDGPGLVAAAEKHFTSEAFALTSLGQMMPGKERFNESPATTVQDYLAAATPVFQRIVGRKPTGIPLIIPVGLRAADADERIAELRYFVIVEVPADELLKKIETERAALAKAAQPARPLPARVGAAEPENANPAGVNERIGQLEERIKALEGKLDLLTRLLAEQLGKKAEPKQ